MVLPGHLAGGYLATTLLLASAGFPMKLDADWTTLMIVGTLAGEAPDIDLLFFNLHQRFSKNPSRYDNHREFITHTPIFWIALCSIMLIMGIFINSIFVQLLAQVILVGSLSHFLLDSLEDGIRWLYPLSSRLFYLRKVAEHKVDGVKGTLRYYYKLLNRTFYKRITFYAEIIILIIAIWVAFR